MLAPLGADVSSSINVEPDGAFSNHPANPEDKKHVAATIDAVAASGADVRVMLDCDVDRCGLIDGTTPKPEPVNRNRLVALAAQVALEDGNGVIVTDPVTSGGMTQFIEERGGTHDRFKMGYRNVIDRAADTKPEPALLAIEAVDIVWVKTTLWMTAATRRQSCLGGWRRLELINRIVACWTCEAARSRSPRSRSGGNCPSPESG